MSIESLWIGLLQMQEFAKDPLVMVRGDGVRIWDSKGRSYLEGNSLAFANSLGHGNRRVIDAAKAQLETLAFCDPTNSTSDRMIELGGRVLELAGDRYGAIKFLNGGSEAIEAATKIARQYHKQHGEPSRYKVICRYGAYHGATLAALTATGIPEYRERYEPLASGFVHVSAPPPQWSPAHDEDDPWVDELRATIENEGPETVSLVLIEPVMNRAGVILPQAGHLERVRTLCDEYGILLAFDEVVTGFGRVGSWFAAARYHTWPDLLCVGKGISSGYAAMSAVLVAEHVAAEFRGAISEGRHYLLGHTFGGNPVACAVALAVAAEIEERGLLDHADAMGRRLLQGLSVCSDRVTGVRGVGLLTAVDLALSDDERDSFEQRLLRHGLHVAGPSAEGTLRLAPPLVVTPEEIDEIVAIVGLALSELGG